MGVARSTLNTPRKQRARGGHKREVVEAGDGLFARRRFEAKEKVLDYAFMNGVSGERVDHLDMEERWLRYPATPGNPEGTGKYLLQIGNGRLYLDALKQDSGPSQGIGRAEGNTGRCGLGGKVNTNPGKQNARFKGSKIYAGRAIRSGEEIFVPYGRGFRLEGEVVDEERSGWGVSGKRFFRDMG